jgi:CDP-diacylglycerol--glycerol-3-phosphate 3-phosphatidyltransferase
VRTLAPVTAPNWISVARIALVPVCVLLLASSIQHHEAYAAIVFAVAALSDLFDGYLARSRGTVTNFGTFVDPLADKLLVTCVLVQLVAMDRLSAWIAMVIVAREFAVSGLRMIAASSEVISANQLGKWKTFIQMLAILGLIVNHSQPRLNDVLVYTAVVLTVASAGTYFWAARGHLRAASGDAA